MAVIDNLAKVFTDVHQGLGAPAGLSSIQIKRAVHEAFALYWTDLIQSDQNQVIKTSDSIPFVANQYIYDLSDITDMTMPDWVEIQVGSNENDWVLVSVVNRDSLAMFRYRREIACSIYSRLENNVLVNSIEFSYTPWTVGSENNNFRIWYDPFIQINTTDGEPSGFPPQFNYLIAVEASVSLIEILKQLAIASAAEKKSSEVILQATLSSLTSLKADFLDKRASWRDKWKHYKLASRANQGGRKKRSIMGNIYL